MERTETKLPHKLLAIRESGLRLSEKVQATWVELDFKDNLSVMERIADAKTRRLFHRAVPQLAHLLPEMMQLPTGKKPDEKLFYVPGTNELYNSPDSSKYIAGAEMAIFDPDHREYLGLDRIRELKMLYSNATSPAIRGGLWGYLQALNFEQNTEQPSTEIEKPYLDNKAIDFILEKAKFFTAGTPEETTVNSLLEDIRDIRRKRDGEINMVINKYAGSLKQEAWEFCRCCAATMGYMMPKILQLEYIRCGTTPTQDRYDAFFNLETGSLTIVPMTKRKRFWKTIHEPVEQRRYEARNKEWCVLFDPLYWKARNLLEEGMDYKTSEEVFRDIHINIPIFLSDLNRRLPLI